MTRREILSSLAVAGAALPARAQSVPRPAGEIDFISHKGERILLSNYRGKVVIVEVLLTTCPGCQRCATILSRLQPEYAARGLQVIGLAINQGAGAQLPEFTSKYATSFPVGVYPQDKAFGFLQHSMMKRVLMPQIAFVDRNGNVREQHGGEEAFFNNEEKNLRAAIERLLAEKGAPASSKSSSARKKA